MNNIYKVIWNASLGTWIAVSELAKAKTKSSTVTTLLGSTTLILMVSFSPTATACGSCGGGSGGGSGNPTDGWKINIDATGTGTQISSGLSPAIVRTGDEVKFIAGNNIELNQAGRQIKIATNPDLISDSITTGDSKLDNNGLTITGGPSITTAGINAGSKVITDVADGVANSDAVNLGQLNSTNQNVTDLNNQTFKLQANGDTATAVKSSDTVQFKDGDNIKLSRDGNNITVATAAAVSFDQVAVGSVVTDKTKSTIVGLSNKTLSATDFATVGRAASEEQLKLVSTVANNANQGWKINTRSTGTGTVAGNSSTAVVPGDTVDFIAGNNMALTQAGKSITVAINPNLVAESITTGNSKLNTSGLTIIGGPSITTAGIDAGTKVITNVASGGTTSSNAANIGDLITAVDHTVATLTTTGLNFTGNSGSTVHRDLGQTLAIKGAFTGVDTNTSSENVKTVTTADGIDIRLAKNAVFDSITTGDSKLDNNGLTITGGPSITTAGINAGSKVITDVADGVANSDAVNLGQLNSTNQNVTDLNNQTFKLQANGDTATAVKSSDTVQFKDGDNIKLSRDGNNITVATAAAVSFDQVAVGSVVTDKTKSTIVGLSNKTLSATDFATVGRAASEEQLKLVSTVANNANQGWKINTRSTGTGTVAGNSSTAVVPGDTVDFIAGNNMALTQAGKSITVAINPNLVAESITTGNSKLNTSGLTIIGGPSITTAGIDAGTKVITNVASGVAASDAVNVGQLNSAVSHIQNNVNQINDQAVLYNKNPDETVDKNNITLAGGSNGSSIHNLADGVIAAGSKDAVNGGQLADVRDNLQGQIDITTNYLTNIQTTLDSGSMGLVQQVGGPKGPITVAHDTGGTVVNVSGTDGNRVVTGVANGAVTATSTDAVNGSQLNSTNQAVVGYLGGGAGYDNITGSFNAPTYNVDNKAYNNVGGAIDALNQVDQNLNTKIDNVSNKLDNAFRATNDRIDRAEERANAGIAAAMALEAAPYIPGKYTYAVGAAYHHSENAVGVTLRKTANNGRWSVTGGIAVASQGDPSVRIGISGVIN